MSSFTKWLFAGLGWAIAGPIGALLGYAARTHKPRAQDANANKQRQSDGLFGLKGIHLFQKKKGGDAILRFVAGACLISR